MTISFGKPPFDPADVWVEIGSLLFGLIVVAVVLCLIG